MAKLPLKFYQRDTTEVALDLLGKRLVHIYKGQRLSGLITEVEAYLGVKDRACHTYAHRRTPRTEAMYAPGGSSYIYFIYGMYHCFNVVTQKEEIPEAVLIRSLEPLEGVEQMQKFRNQTQLKNLTTGPGKLAQALQLTMAENRVSLNSETLFIEKEKKVALDHVVKRPRVGVDYAGGHAKWPLRFYIKNSSFVSKK